MSIAGHISKQQTLPSAPSDAGSVSGYVSLYGSTNGGTVFGNTDGTGGAFDLEQAGYYRHLLTWLSPVVLYGLDLDQTGKTVFSRISPFAEPPMMVFEWKMLTSVISTMLMWRGGARMAYC